MFLNSLFKDLFYVLLTQEPIPRLCEFVMDDVLYKLIWLFSVFSPLIIYFLKYKNSKINNLKCLVVTLGINLIFFLVYIFVVINPLLKLDSF